MKLSAKILVLAFFGVTLAILLNGFITYYITQDILSRIIELTRQNLAGQITFHIMFVLVPLVFGLFGLVAYFIIRTLQSTEELELTHAVLEESVKIKTIELEKKIKETERMNKFMLGRELKMIEMKKELDTLKKENEHASSDNQQKDPPIITTNGTEEGDTKKALLNIMEDLQVERDNAQKEQAKDEAVLSSIGDGLILTDNEGNVLRINESAQKMFELDEKTSIGKSWLDIIQLYDEDASPITKENRPISIALQKNERVSKTCILVKPGDQKVTINITASPVLQHDKLTNEENIIGAIAVIRDITKEKEIDRMKTEFISLASHQLRTPLSAIKWFGEMLFNGDAGVLNDEQKEFAKNINDSTERMIELVNSLLNISRIESGRIIIDPKPTDLKELVETIVKELQVKLTAKHQKLVISVHQDLPEINVDPKLIRQVYLNLLTNAIKYTPDEGEIMVFISKKEDQVLSQVSDNGYGIPTSQQSKIFQRFFRAQNIIKIETDGTGLGLYLIKAIIEASHGKIWFKSEEGKGTSFWFTLPLSGMVAKKGEVSIDA